ncbi:peptidase associated/transthyretin-like domain-containing protein [Chryseobacterium indologenes]|uniref:hypothetical protein n=1 Tax=Chryseobacterium indologenes TaxID=253 RepID=UPI0003E0612F|nr:hypothetical protein [Chryseobacterium indologenes]GAE65606.1 hypothetical protein CIN01S_11_02420 [Chryseobacterium indologenes NBRC 14944]SFK18455.1 hypothetical protein SAMN05421692_3685 [Chryseobacterium indologenes]SUX51620.1 Uncharacterised protein [Chryseobacterium indologenes]
MKNSLKIHNPCPENWDDMQDLPSGKFCEKCSRCVIDFTHKTDEEIRDIFNTADGEKICGRITTRSAALAAAGIILITNLSFVQAQTKDSFRMATEQKAANITKVSGRLISNSTKKEIPGAEVFFICKSKYIKAITHEDGTFALEIPNELIEKKNILYFDFDKMNEVERKVNNKKDSITSMGLENETVIFEKNEKLENKEFQIESQYATIGGVVIMSERPPDYYYFNGKSISERKFEKLQKENPKYQFFFFKGKEAEVISRKTYLNSLRLLYSD